MSLRYIANRVGVSTATVSNVINRKGCVSQEILDRVFALMETENIVIKRRKKKRNPTARRLVMFGITEDVIFLENGAFHSQLTRGLRAVLGVQRYSLILASSTITPDNIRRETRGVDALLLIGSTPTPEVFTEPVPVPVEWLFRTKYAPGDIIADDHREIGWLAAKYFSEKGHKAVGYVDDCKVESMKEKGLFFKHYMESLGGRAVVVTGNGLFAPGDGNDYLDLDSLRRLLNLLLADGNEVTGLFVAGSRLLVAVSAILKEMNVHDLEVIPCVGVTPGVKGVGGTAYIDINLEDIGRRAAECALWRIDNPDEKPVRVLVSPSLVMA